MGNLIINPIAFFTDTNGDPLQDGSVYVGVADANPISNPVAVYQDAAMTIPVEQPLRTVDGYVSLNGVPQPIYSNLPSYSLMALDQSGDTALSVPNYTNSLASEIGGGGAAQIGFDGTTLDQVIKLRLNRVVDSINQLRVLPSTLYSRVFVSGYYTPHDGGGGNYQVDPDDTTSIDNGGTIIEANDGARWKLSHYGAVSSRQFGAKADGTTDDTAVLQTFMAAVATLGIRGVLQAGTYLLSNTVTIQLGSIGFELVGPGNGAVNFITAASFPAAPVLQILGSGVNVGFTIGGFSIGPGAGGAGGAVVGFQIGSPVTTTNINGFQFSTIKDVQITGFPTLWAVVHARMIRFSNCAGWNPSYASANSCLALYQNGHFTGDLVFDTCQFVSSNASGNNAVGIGSTVGPYNGNTGDCSVSGIKFTKCDLYAGQSAISAVASNGGYISDIWVMDGTQIDQDTEVAINMLAVGALSLIQNVHIGDAYIAKSTTAQIQIAAQSSGTVSDVYIHDNQIIRVVNNGVNCYGVGGTLREIHVNDNIFPDANTASALMEFNAVSRFSCNDNNASGVFGVTVAKHIVQIESGCVDFVVTGNNGAEYTSGSVINDMSGDVQKVVTGNPGYNPQASQILTVGASPFTYKNTSGALQMVTIAGGIVTGIEMATGIGQLAIVPTGNNQITLPAGIALSVSYSSLPNMYTQGLD